MDDAHLADLKTDSKSCFPWAVVEMKRHAATSTERCYCQAANATAAALEMQVQLFGGVGNDASLQTPPIVGFTCVGPHVKVWLTYEYQSEHSGERKKVSGFHFCHCRQADAA
jgi:hypothetical protein